MLFSIAVFKKILVAKNFLVEFYRYTSHSTVCPGNLQFLLEKIPRINRRMIPSGIVSVLTGHYHAMVSFYGLQAKQNQRKKSEITLFIGAKQGRFILYLIETQAKKPRLTFLLALNISGALS